MADTASTGAQPGTFIDPYRNYNFKLDIHGVNEAHFAQCSGIGICIDVLQYREGGVQQVVHNIPGRVHNRDIELRYGLTSSSELWTWFFSGVQGRVDRKNVSIILLDADGVTEVARWNLVNAWPKEWRGAALDTLGKEVAIETLVLTFETLERG
jgi:phage tail-like protein